VPGSTIERQANRYTAVAMKNTKTIALVDDEPDILKLVSLHLERESYCVKSFETVTAFFAFISKKLPDLIVLDLLLPDEDGLDVCKQLKRSMKYSSIPIIMLTAKSRETDKIIGLELGADDYVTKPFSPRELMARVKAVLRRTEKSHPSVITIGDVLSIDKEQFQVIINNRPVELTPVEFKILEFLSMNPGKLFSRGKILDYLWGNEKAVQDRTVDVHIKNIRQKLGDANYIIKNVRGFGYKLEI